MNGKDFDTVAEFAGLTKVQQDMTWEVFRIADVSSHLRRATLGERLLGVPFAKSRHCSSLAIVPVYFDCTDRHQLNPIFSVAYETQLSCGLGAKSKFGKHSSMHMKMTLTHRRSDQYRSTGLTND